MQPVLFGGDSSRRLGACKLGGQPENDCWGIAQTFPAHPFPFFKLTHYPLGDARRIDRFPI